MEKKIDLRCYAFRGDEILLKKNADDYTIPLFADVEQIPNESFEISLPDGDKGITASADKETDAPIGYEWIRLRPAYFLLSEQEYANAGKAFQLKFWNDNSRFCPRCGTKTVHEREIMKKCPSCGNEIFPHVSPAILVLIRRGEEALLVRSKNFRRSFYGLVAGFVETGESLEQCVRREVMEETGLTIKNLRYYDNQTWPYPSNLMIGFMADYESGEIKLQEDELCAGQFFSRENLPELPTYPSLARKMIDVWLSEER
jgi:NAD+ diphosphatase